MNRWLPASPPVARFALGGVLFQPQADHAAGYVQLGQYLPAVKLDPDSSDFSYQINRPRDSKTNIPNLRVNRLTKWSVAMMRGLAIEAGKDATKVSDVSQEFACRLEFDVNSAADFKGDLPPERLSDLLAEFATLVQEIAAHGDVTS